jgi:ATP-dependent DNA helicase DinG
VAEGDYPALVAGIASAAWLDGGEARTVAHREAAELARGRAPLVCHLPSLARRLGVPAFPAHDVLELFAFVRPASFAVPTSRGLAQALGLPVPTDLAGETQALRVARDRLLQDLSRLDEKDAAEARGIAEAMGEGGWTWTPDVVNALRHVPALRRAMDVWQRIPEWAEQAPEPPPGSQAVDPAEARKRLAELTGHDAEPRPQQADYASAVSFAFQPRAAPGIPHMVLAEAGTGVGKTLGYLAPATVWAEKNGAPVWISTYTRNLQHQVDTELDRLVADPEEKARRVVVRKGRENYLCLLNLEEAIGASELRRRDRVALGLMARWARASRDGDMVGGDFPSWLPDLTGRGRTLELADQRGECVYSACPHYHRCFIERSVRRARRAEIVIANHALVMVQAAFGGLDEAYVPQRYVFDEGHHVFDAADSAFSAHLSGFEMAELRRWILGAEAKRGSRARGLRRRVGDLAADDADAMESVERAEAAARALPSESWLQRINGGEARGPGEAFLALVRTQVYARAPEPHGPYGLEADTRPPLDGLIAAAATLEAALSRLARPLQSLASRLDAKLDAESAALDSPARLRIEAIVRGLRRRTQGELAAWQDMLGSLRKPAADDMPATFVDWFDVDRIESREFDVGFRRHWVDPTLPFAEHVAGKSHGLVVTSATLRDGTGDEETDWAAAEARTGTAHLPAPAVRAAVPSPFDYPRQTAIYVVTDVRKTELDQIAAAYRELFLAAGGGALGLFTAISRLKAVHARVAKALEREGLPLYAQHVDPWNTTTLVDVFRAEVDACLLGTDAVRDGVDVPGPALRLIVSDRVPWPRPDILHRARKAAFHGRAYDDMIARLRLKQAYGRLVRRADDRGIFVMLDPAMPSRLSGAFPEGVEIRRQGLAATVEAVRAFFQPSLAPQP